METNSNSIEDGLINGLSYKLDATASYITDRVALNTRWEEMLMPLTVEPKL